ncbi:MAG: Na+/H+ antiporter NhaC family protein, partial [Spirochaetes bacterium]|nr:Na+/H+ antiporter NhaC family protein [Spirochaetota bacterium]
IGTSVNAYTIFIQTIPYRFYNILILLFVFLNVIMAKEFGSMLKAERRAKNEGKLMDDNAKPLSSESSESSADEKKIKLNIWNALIPIAVLILSALSFFYLSGYRTIMAGKDHVLITLITEHPFSLVGLQKAFSNSNASIVLFQAAALACLTGIIMGMSQKVFSLKQAIEIWLKGARALLITVFILILAWTLTGIIKELGTAKYIVSVLSDSIPKMILPGSIFLLAALISFATGTSYGTMGILMPLAIPLAHAVSPTHEFLVMSIGAVLTGSIFGDHSSPISDTTVLSSMGAASDHIDHVKTQLVYAVFVAIISLFLCYLPVSMGIPVYFVLPAAVLVMGIMLFFIGKPVIS